MMTSLVNKLRWVYIRNNSQSFFFTTIYIVISLGLFFGRYYQYKDTTVALALARASAMVIYFQSAMILILILRKSITFLRSIGMAHYLPLDHYVYFHKVTGWSIAFFSLLHTLAHLYNFASLTTITTVPYFRFLFALDLGIGWFAGSACLTGWILIVIIAIMLVLSMSFIRRTGNFEIFYYSHKLYIVYYIFLFFHGFLSFRWLLFPMMLFLFEKISAFIKATKDQHGMTYAIEGTLLPSRVLRLVIRKPKFLTFQPGDFVYVMVPSITKYEWHPITISSAPEDEDITIHIRAVGEWTNRMYDHFDNAKTLSLKKMLEEWKCLEFHPRFTKEVVSGEHSHHSSELLMKRTMILPIPDDCDEDGCGKKKRVASRSELSDVVSIEMAEVPGNNNEIRDEDLEDKANQSLSMIQSIQQGVQSNAIFLKEPLKIHLEGPYGAPSSNIFQSEHAVLIATGIGVTPFASILQSIMYRHIEKTRHCPKCQYSWTERVLSQRVMSLKKVDFVWINRDQTSFEWFVELLSDLNKQQYALIGSKDDEEQRFFDIHMYVTGRQEPVQQDDIQLENYRHSLNLKFGRPDWNEFFARIQQQSITRSAHRVTVFYCGRPDLGDLLRNYCSHYDFRFKKEVF